METVLLLIAWSAWSGDGFSSRPLKRLGAVRLFRVGRALHLSRDGYLVVEAQGKAEIGSTVYDSKLRPLGVVSDIIGPTSASYVLVKTKLKDASGLRGQVLYGVVSEGR